MFKMLLVAASVAIVAMGGAAAAQPYEPYGGAVEANTIYNLLFCDDAAAFRAKPKAKPADWQALLYGAKPAPAKVEALAGNAAADSRVRALAFNWLRAHGHPAPKGDVLGVIIEIPLDQGLDVLAAYADGRVQFISHTGKMAMVEPGGLPAASAEAKRLVALAQPVVARIGPSDKVRQPPPANPNVRLTFVVSDGLYLGEGPFEVMQSDPLAGPLVQQGAKLLTLVVDGATQR